MARAYSPNEVLSMKKKYFDFEGEWYDAFDKPETSGVWFVSATSSGSGKTSFILQLAKMLCKFGKVLHVSLEEGTCGTMQRSLRRFGMDAVNKKFQIVLETMEELDERLAKRKSADIVIIDSFQYTGFTFKQFLDFIKKHPKKIFIVISQSESRKLSRPAEKVMYHADLKIYIEGYVAFSKGRYKGETGKYTIWQEGADKYWGGIA